MPRKQEPLPKRYRLVLEEVTGPEDDEEIEIVADWSLTDITPNDASWTLDQNLWDSIKEAVEEVQPEE